MTTIINLYKSLEGRLVDIENGDGFNFYVSEEHWYNQQNYEKLGEVQFIVLHTAVIILMCLTPDDFACQGGGVTGHSIMKCCYPSE